MSENFPPPLPENMVPDPTLLVANQAQTAQAEAVRVADLDPATAAFTWDQVNVELSDLSTGELHSDTASAEDAKAFMLKIADKIEVSVESGRPIQGTGEYAPDITTYKFTRIDAEGKKTTEEVPYHTARGLLALKKAEKKTPATGTEPTGPTTPETNPPQAAQAKPPKPTAEKPAREQRQPREATKPDRPEAKAKRPPSLADLDREVQRAIAEGDFDAVEPLLGAMHDAYVERALRKGFDTGKAHEEFDQIAAKYRARTNAKPLTGAPKPEDLKVSNYVNREGKPLGSTSELLHEFGIRTQEGDDTGIYSLFQALREAYIHEFTSQGYDVKKGADLADMAIKSRMQKLDAQRHANWIRENNIAVPDQTVNPGRGFRSAKRKVEAIPQIPETPEEIHRRRSLSVNAGAIAVRAARSIPAQGAKGANNAPISDEANAPDVAELARLAEENKAA